MTTKNKTEKLLTTLPHHIKVFFAYHCCLYIKDKMNEPGLKCMELVESWLKDKSLVSDDELRNAAYAAYAASNTASNAVYHAAYAVYYAAHAASNAAYAVYHAAHAAYHAYDAAYHAASNAVYEEKMNQYYLMLKQMVKDMTELEKLIYNIDMEELC